MKIYIIRENINSGDVNILRIKILVVMLMQKEMKIKKKLNTNFKMTEKSRNMEVQSYCQYLERLLQKYFCFKFYLPYVCATGNTFLKES